MNFVRPYRLATVDCYCVVFDALGRVVAQGQRWMCERVIAGLPIIGKQGSLF